jgi:hypothetical protein
MASPVEMSGDNTGFWTAVLAIAAIFTALVGVGASWFRTEYRTNTNAEVIKDLKSRLESTEEAFMAFREHVARSYLDRDEIKSMIADVRVMISGAVNEIKTVIQQNDVRVERKVEKLEEKIDNAMKRVA